MRYPVEVRSSAGRAWASTIAGLVLAAAMIGVHVWNLRDPEMHAEGLTLAVAVGFALLAVYTAVAVRVSFVRLHADRIEVVGVFRTSVRRLADVTGVRRGTDDSFVLATREGVRPLLLSRRLLRDPAMKAWVEALPHLDAEEARAAEAALVRDERLGADEADRRTGLARLRQAGAALNLAALGLAGWLVFWPEPYRVAVWVNCAAPLAAFALAFWRPGLFTLAPRNTIEVHANLMAVICLPAGALTLRATKDVDLVDWGSAALAAALAAAAALALARAADDEAKRAPVLLGAMLLAWAWGAGVLLNGVLDTAPPRLVPATVVERQGRAHDDPRVAVRAEGRVYGDLDVSARRWEGLRQGSHVCLVEFAGRFGWRYVVAGGACDGGPALPVRPTEAAG